MMQSRMQMQMQTQSNMSTTVKYKIFNPEKQRAMTGGNNKDADMRALYTPPQVPMDSMSTP